MYGPLDRCLDESKYTHPTLGFKLGTGCDKAGGWETWMCEMNEKLETLCRLYWNILIKVWKWECMNMRLGRVSR